MAKNDTFWPITLFWRLRIFLNLPKRCNSWITLCFYLFRCHWIAFRVPREGFRVKNGPKMSLLKGQILKVNQFQWNLVYRTFWWWQLCKFISFLLNLYIWLFLGTFLGVKTGSKWVRNGPKWPKMTIFGL